MTKKTFIALANAVRATRPPNPEDDQLNNYEPLILARKAAIAQWTTDVAMLADFCASQNSRFDRERWLAYIAGVNGPSGGQING